MSGLPKRLLKVLLGIIAVYGIVIGTITLPVGLFVGLHGILAAAIELAVGLGAAFPLRWISISK